MLLLAESDCGEIITALLLSVEGTGGSCERGANITVICGVAVVVVLVDAIGPSVHVVEGAAGDAGHPVPVTETTVAVLGSGKLTTTVAPGTKSPLLVIV